MNTPQPRTDEVLRKELVRLGAREYEQVALGMDSKRGLAAIHYAVNKGVEHPISYAITLFDNPEWHPSGEVHRKGTNLHSGRPKALPAPARERNLTAAREAMEKLWPSE